MDIHNLAIVRATNHIPVDGTIYPTSEECVLHEGSYIDSYSMQIKRLLKTRDKNILKDYIPLTGEYNSMTLFSINGIVPDDGEISAFAGNVFSNKSCAIIDGLEEHIDEIISLNPTDTAIKGSAKLSSNAVILINEKAIKSLTDEQIEFLQKNYTFATFTGSLKDAVTTFLTKSKRYTSEDLLTVSDNLKDLKAHLYNESNPLKEDVDYEFVSTVNDVAEKNSISLAFHYDIIYNRTDLEGRLECAKGEFNKMQIVDKFYKELFYDYVSPQINIDDDTKYYLIHSDSDFYFELLSDFITEYGLENYRQLVMNYNKALKNLKDSKKLPTAQQIVDCEEKGEPINISQLIDEEVKKINFQESPTSNSNNSFGENEGTNR